MISAVIPFLQAAAAEEGGKGSLADVEFGLTIWTIVLFGLFAFALAKFAWNPILQIIEDREKGVRDAVDGAQKANADAQTLLEKHKELVREAGREREEILKKALQEADALKTDLQTRARAESDQMIARAKEQVDREKAAAIQELRSQVADLAIEAASKIVTSSLTPEAQRKLVNDFIGSMAKAQ